MSITGITIYSKTSFEDIPAKPEETGIWMMDAHTALWFTTYDNKWRFMRMVMNERTMRSVENFESKHKASLFISDNKPTWTSTPLTVRENQKTNDKQELLKKDELTVIWHEGSTMMSILTKHGLIRVYPDRKDKTCTLISINTDNEKLSHYFSKHLSEDLLSIEATGYTPDDDYWMGRE